MKKINMRGNLVCITCLIILAGVLLLAGCTTTSSAPTSTLTSTPSTSAPAATIAPPTYVVPPTQVGKTTSAPASSHNANIEVVPSAKSVKPGEKFDIFIKVDSQTPTRGAQCTLKWDPAKVECNSVEIGKYYQDFAKENKGELMILPNPLKADNEIGQFPQGLDPINKISKSAAIALAGATGADGALLGPVGSGDLLVLHMTAKTMASGDVKFSLSNVLLKDNSKPSISLDAKVIETQLTISP